MAPRGMSQFGWGWMIAGALLAAAPFHAAEAQEDPPAKAQEQDAPNPADPANQADPADQADPIVKWQLLQARKQEISQRLPVIQKEFANAPRERQIELKREFEGLVGEYRRQIHPEMLQIARDVYAADSKNVEAGELALENAFRDRDLDAARKLGEALRSSGYESKYVLNYLGSTYFFQKDYENAKATLEAAEKAGQLDRGLNEQALKVATAYLDFEKEPSNVSSAEIVVQDMFDNNRFQEALDLAAKLKNDGKASKIVKNVAAAAHFALDNFEEAKKQRDELQAAGELDPAFDQQFLQHAEEYVDLWRKEQELRAAEAKLPPEKQLPRVVLHTSRGDVELELFEDQAPNTVANMVHLAENGRYDGIKFHRVIPNFVVQGGDPNTLDDDPANDGQGDFGYSIKCECYEDDARMHFRGSLSMAHAGRDTGGSQFFITHRATPHLNPNAEQQRGHTVFGRVVDEKSQAVVDRIQQGDVIEKAEVIRKRDHEYKPVTIANEPANSPN